MSNGIGPYNSSVNLDESGIGAGGGMMDEDDDDRHRR